MGTTKLRKASVRRCLPSTAAAGLAGVTQVAANLWSGERDLKALSASTAKATWESAAKAATAMAVKQGAHVVPERVGHEGLKRIVRGNAATGVIFAAVDQFTDGARLRAGEIEEDEYYARTAAKVSGTGAALLGAEIGTAICPGVGTVTGGLVGGLTGSAAGRSVYQWLFA
jgi:hypothetical protein